MVLLTIYSVFKFSYFLFSFFVFFVNFMQISLSHRRPKIYIFVVSDKKTNCSGEPFRVWKSLGAHGNYKILTFRRNRRLQQLEHLKRAELCIYVLDNGLYNITCFWPKRRLRQIDPVMMTKSTWFILHFGDEIGPWVQCYHLF